MKTFVMGDIHGAYKAFRQCMQRANFRYRKDRLIGLGDIVDRHDEVSEYVEELLKIPNLIAIRGNQGGGKRPKIPGGYALTYVLNPEDIPKRHRNFFLKCNSIISMIREDVLCMEVLIVSSHLPVNILPFTIGTGSYGSLLGHRCRQQG